MGFYDDAAGVTYMGTSSKSLGLSILYGANDWLGANYASSMTQIPGRSAAEIVPSNRYNNVSQVFEFTRLTSTPFMEVTALSRAVSRWLFSTDPKQYQKLSYDGSPNLYYMAVPTAVSSFKISDRTSISFSVTFSCQPFAYEVGGDEYQSVVSGDNLINDRPWNSYPLWHISGTGNGSFILNGVTYNFLGLNGDLYVDSDTEDVYDSQGNYQPGMVQFTNYAFPVLSPGDNKLTDISALNLEVMPRWRTML
ncbi:hypothetical protein EFT87_03950 [Schleiferilactobacillus harbinensis]|uniref:hypothetical protein n=1 Tax=Schleiferilactobacillus harbinensis TaxID=304207 RepID=UPI0021A629E1|nr:hypothetical protein [Schleiferilactobacillus harbinensis]MCT2907814.1 hypothetical protein [Schleiferilactobacillus harbinensis]